MKKKLLHIIGIVSGVGISQTALWGGTYLEHLLERSDWRVEPLFITALVIGLSGVALTMYNSTALGIVIFAEKEKSKNIWP